MDEQDISQSVFVTAIVFIVVTTAAVALKLWARIIVVKTWGWDDVLLSISQLFLVSHLAVTAVASKHGLGVGGQLTEEQRVAIYKLQIPISILYSICVTTAKASFALLYLRIFPMKKLRILNKALLVFLAGQGIEESLVVALKCLPAAKAWYPDLPGHCIDIHPFWYTSFIFNLIADLTLFIQPIPFSLKLQMPLAKRVGLLIMMSLGLLVTAISVIRLYYIIELSNGARTQLAVPSLWSSTEAASLILASCIPSLRQVCAKIPWLNAALGLSTGGTGATSNAYRGKSGGSIPLGKWRHKDYIQSEAPRGNWSSNPFGTTTRVTAAKSGLDNDSQEEIFPNSSDYHGAIMITREVVHKVEED